MEPSIPEVQTLCSRLQETNRAAPKPDRHPPLGSKTAASACEQSEIHLEDRFERDRSLNRQGHNRGGKGAERVQCLARRRLQIKADGVRVVLARNVGRDGGLEPGFTQLLKERCPEKRVVEWCGPERNHRVLVGALVALAVGGLAWVFLYPLLSGEKKAQQRRAGVARAGAPQTTGERISQSARRGQIEETLKEIDQKHRQASKLSLATRITMAGLSWSKRQYILISAGLGFVVLFLVLIVSGSLIARNGSIGHWSLTRWPWHAFPNRSWKLFLRRPRHDDVSPAPAAASC